MENFKKAQAILLPTDKSNLFILNNKELRYTTIGGRVHKVENSEIYKPQHLYIVSDEPIKEGDWCLDLRFKTIHQLTANAVGNHLEGINTVAKKIIATTDKSLKIENATRQLGDDEPNLISLPYISEQFITDYIKQYNLGELIIDVMVEYQCLIAKGSLVLQEKGVKLYPYNTINIKINKTNKIISIGYIAHKTCYLNISKEEAIQRYLKSENITQEQFIEWEVNVDEIEFDDEFTAYDIW